MVRPNLKKPNKVDEIKIKSNIRKTTKINNWVSASAGRNYMINTPIDDLFCWMSKNDINTTASATVTNNILFEQGNKFEEVFINYIKSKFIKDFVSIRPPQNSKFDLAAELSFKFDRGRFEPAAGSLSEKTLKAIKEKKGIIYSGVLINPKNQTYGIPDLIILGRNVKSIFPEWTKKFNKEIKNDYYYIFDLKYTTLAVKVDSITLRNDGTNKCYKSQIMIYNDALKYFTGKSGRNGFLIGRSIKSSSAAVNNEFKELAGGMMRLDWEHQSLIECFISIAKVDSSDREIADKSNNSIMWIRKMRKSAPAWSKVIKGILCDNKIKNNFILPAAELYPNMSSSAGCGPWSKEKKKLASIIGEITMIWRIGVAGRIYSHGQGIYSWKDPKFKNEILPAITTHNIQKKMIESVDTKLEIVISADTKTILKSEGKYIDLFVDFEGISSAFLPFAEQDIVNNDKLGKNMLTMIGVVDNYGRYYNFHVENLSRAAEYTICNNFAKFIKNNFNKNKVRIFHWSPAEPSSWKRYGEYYKELHLEVQWIDLHKIFIEEQIVIPGIFSFGLKDVTAGLIAAGRIDKKYGYGSCKIINSGLGAMFSTINCYKKEDEKLLNEIISYNEIDCRILMEILKILKS